MKSKVSEQVKSIGVSTLACFFALAFSPGLANSPFAANPLRLLFLGGGSTSHDPAAMRAVIQPVFEKAGMQVEYHTNESVLKGDSLSRFDALFVYNAKKGSKTDGSPDLTTAQEDALYAWVEAGHPFIAAHGASSSYLGNPRWVELIGAEYTEHGSDFQYVTIAQPNHPAMQGVTPPTGWDEGRLHHPLKQDLTVLETLNPEKTPWTWVRPQGKGWVYYTSSGHDTRTWSDTSYQTQLVQAIRWGVTASQPVSTLAFQAKRLRFATLAWERGDFVYPNPNGEFLRVDFVGRSETMPQQRLSLPRIQP